MAEERVENIDELEYVEQMEVRAKLNLRVAPNKQADIIKVMPVGEKVYIEQEKEGWVYTGEGWCMKEFLK